MGAVPGAAQSKDHGVVWVTPDDFFRGVSDRFGPFDLDAAASHDNAKVARYFTVDDDALSQEWEGRVWVNPPYGRDHNEPWATKAAEAVGPHGKADLVAFLHMPATETKWFFPLFGAAELHFVRPRLRFSGRQGGGTFPSVLAIFRRGHQGPPSFYLMRTDGSRHPWPSEPDSEHGGADRAD